MRKLSIPIASLGLAAALAGCNSTDALTPQVDVGGGTFRSPPVTQSDLDAMSTQTAVVPVESAPASRTAAFSTQPKVSRTPTQYATGNTGYTDPAGTLDAQASRLAQGEAPAQSAAAPEQSTRQPALDQPTHEQPSTHTQPAPAQTTAAAPEQHASLPAASPAATAAGSGAIRFLPIIGAPVQAVTPLSKQLGADARAHGLAIKGSADTTSEHILKGYFSALNDGGKTTVVYVWDVLDGSGNRLHRIQGQDTVASTAADPWSAVPPETMQTIATRTINAYLEWRQSRPG